MNIQNIQITEIQTLKGVSEDINVSKALELFFNQGNLALPDSVIHYDPVTRMITCPNQITKDQIQAEAEAIRKRWKTAGIVVGSIAISLMLGALTGGVGAVIGRVVSSVVGEALIGEGAVFAISAVPGAIIGGTLGGINGKKHGLNIAEVKIQNYINDLNILNSINNVQLHQKCNRIMKALVDRVVTKINQQANILCPLTGKCFAMAMRVNCGCHFEYIAIMEKLKKGEDICVNCNARIRVVAYDETKFDQTFTVFTRLKEHFKEVIKLAEPPRNIGFFNEKYVFYLSDEQRKNLVNKINDENFLQANEDVIIQKIQNDRLNMLESYALNLFLKERIRPYNDAINHFRHQTDDQLTVAYEEGRINQTTYDRESNRVRKLALKCRIVWN